MSRITLLSSTTRTSATRPPGAIQGPGSLRLHRAILPERGPPGGSTTLLGEPLNSQRWYGRSLRARSRAQGRPPPRVWIVDDSPLDGSTRVGRSRSTRRRGLRDGSAVLERLANGSAPDVLVLDWVMPGVTGIEVCKFLRSSGDPRDAGAAHDGSARVAADRRGAPRRRERLPREALRGRGAARARRRARAVQGAARARRGARRRSSGPSSRPCPTRSCREPAGQVAFANDEALRVLAPRRQTDHGRARRCRAAGPPSRRRRTRARVLPDVHIGPTCSSRSSGRSCRDAACRGPSPSGR